MCCIVQCRHFSLNLSPLFAHASYRVAMVFLVSKFCLIKDDMHKHKHTGLSWTGHVLLTILSVGVQMMDISESFFMNGSFSLNTVNMLETS